MNFHDELKHLQYTEENQWLERKSARKKPADLLKHLIGFANADGGQLVIGIEDKKSNNIITGFKDGQAYPMEEFMKIDRELRYHPLNLTYRKLPVINCKGEDDFILVVSVEVSVHQVIVAPNDEVYLRQGDETVRLSYEQRIQLDYDKGQRFFEDEIIPNATLSDLNPELVKKFETRFNVSNRSMEEVLKARHFIVDGKLTKAAILLFGKEPSLWLPQARVRFLRFEGVTMGTGSSFNVIKDVSFEDPLPILIPKLKDFMNTQLREFQYLDENGEFKIIPEYPEFAWFEGIINAVTHRNYSLYGDHIRIKMFDDRLEIESPGKLPNIVTIKNIKHERFSRNPRLARTLTEFGWVREMNEGVKRIYSEMENAFLHAPVYTEPGNKVLLTLKNSILSRQIRKEDSLINKLPDFRNLSEDEQAIISYMFNTRCKMTSNLAMEKTKRSKRYVLNLLHRLTNQCILRWHGSNKSDKNQYYSLGDWAE